MKRTAIAFVVALAAVVSGNAQIRYVTVPTVKSPVPPMGFPPFTSPTNAPVVATAPVSTPVIVPLPQPRPSLDKAELEQRVVVFQKQAAEEGSASAQYELGLRYLTGKGVDRDPVLARKWLKQAAEGGNREAEKKLQDLSKAPKTGDDGNAR